MTGEAVEKITELAQMSAKESTVEIDGETYTTRKLTRVSFDPTVETLTVHTLDAFIELVNRNFDGVYEPGWMMIHVEGTGSVRLITKPITTELHRACPMKAEMVNADEYEFGKWHELETFTIRLASMFQPTPDLQAITEYIRKVDVSEKVQYADDGITQVAEIRRGTSGAVTDPLAAKSYARLVPYRTFREIDQPQSEFLFRLKTENGHVFCALFEADGGAWKIEAVKKIEEYIREKLTVEILVVS